MTCFTTVRNVDSLGPCRRTGNSGRGLRTVYPALRKDLLVSRKTINRRGACPSNRSRAPVLGGLTLCLVRYDPHRRLRLHGAFFMKFLTRSGRFLKPCPKGIATDSTPPCSLLVVNLLDRQQQFNHACRASLVERRHF